MNKYLLLIACSFLINNSYAELIISYKQLTDNKQLILIKSTKKEAKELEICIDKKCKTIKMDFQEADTIELIGKGKEITIKI